MALHGCACVEPALQEGCGPFCLPSMGAAACHGGVDCCADQGNADAEEGATRKTIHSMECFADTQEPMCTFDCDAEGEPMKNRPDIDPAIATASLMVRREPRGSQSRLEQSAHLALDREIARSVPLARTLQGLGHLWRSRPNKMSQDELLSLWQSSQKADSYDAFLSHTWWTPGYQKFLSLLLRSYWHFAVLSFAVTCLGIVIMYVFDILPMPLTFAAEFAQWRYEIPCGPWATISGFVVSLLTLLSAPSFPCQRFAVFMDVACIHQTDPRLTRPTRPLWFKPRCLRARISCPNRCFASKGHAFARARHL